MCIICVDLAKQRLTANEAKKHLGEMRHGLGEHAAEVERAIAEAGRDPGGSSSGSSSSGSSQP